MEDPKTKLLARLKESTNVLVTVSANPSLDQLAGAIGLTLLLNKLGKHATAVFSGEVPSIIEYLKPEDTLEKTTDSLRDFIIALDKSKADKLRYKVEDKLVKIFITPYHTAISQKDLEFSQGDFNVDVVIALGVREQKDLDQAIVAHGRILHDATVSSINTSEEGHLGSIHWVDHKSSSLCEMLFTLAQDLQADALDPQMATALLTGIVSETQRFANDRTTARSMGISSQLVAAGANQQLVAAKMETLAEEEEKAKEAAKAPSPKPAAPPEPLQPIAKQKAPSPPPPAKQDKDAGSLQVPHEPEAVEEPREEPDEEGPEEIQIDQQGVLYRPGDDEAAQTPSESSDVTKATDTEDRGNSRIVLEPPSRGGTLTANTKPEPLSPANDALGQTTSTPLLNHSDGLIKDTPGQPDTMMPLPEPQASPTVPTPQPPTENVKTLEQIEESVAGPHQATDTTAAQPPVANLDAARDAVMDAVNSAPTTGPLPPRIDLNANPGLELHQAPPAPDQTPVAPSFTPPPSGGFNPQFSPPTPTMPSPSMPSPSGFSMPPFPPSPTQPLPPAPTPGGFPTNLVSPDTGLPADNTAGPTNSPTPPPPVPPPMMPPNFTPPSHNQ